MRGAGSEGLNVICNSSPDTSIGGEEPGNVGSSESSEVDRLAAEVQQIWLSFQEALRKNRRKYPREEFVRFVTAVRRYADVTREAALVHRVVANAVNGLTDFLRLERESVPGEVVYEADRLECVVFLGFDPHFEGDEPPGL